MSPFLCAAAAAAGLVLSGCADSGRKPQAGPLYASLARPGATIDAAAARDMISIYRTNKGLGVLRLDPALQRAAQAQVRAMAERGGADAQVRKGLRRELARAGYNAKVAVQNVSAGYHTLPEAFAGWRHSRPHNANMLNPSVRRMGIATAYVPGTKYKVYWALVMAD